MTAFIGRREFITLLGGAAAGVAARGARAAADQATGQDASLGLLMPGPAAHSAAILDPFYLGLHELGYVDGQNLTMERRNADWKPDRLPGWRRNWLG